ncbi:MAG: hypothetical protein NPIRA04_02480 [Nitrospirales bacterium]|nr:MAG: hypothetical protein NPIRA04_02480 [Nitrospirales bacterium]
MKQRILIVDDEPVNTRFLESALGFLGFDVVIAHNGREGLEILTHMIVDGVLLDVNMPIMDGRTMLDELRWKGYTMPVIVMSGRIDESTMRLFLQEGAQAFLIKPFDIKPLQNICQRIFEDNQEQQMSSSQLSSRR